MRKFVGYIPKKGSAAYAIIVTMFLSVSLPRSHVPTSIHSASFMACMP